MTDDQIKLLNQEPPANEIRSRRADNGASLLYVEGHYIAETLNSIFGPDGWGREFTGKGLQIVNRSVIDRDGKNLFVVSVLCEYRITLLPDFVVYNEKPSSKPVVCEDVGFGQSDPCIDEGYAIESACKEAVTDALKRCARTLGKALGSCLYDKAWLACHRPAGDGQTPNARADALNRRLDGSVGSPHDDSSQDAPADNDFPQVPPVSENTPPEGNQTNRPGGKRRKP
jgi:DNA recombination protein Rad52